MTGYRSAYKEFLSQQAESGDSQSALRKHLYALDQDRLLKDARKFLAQKVRVVKIK